MKIVFPIGSFYPSQNGGPGNTVYWLTKALTRMGIEVVCITTDYKIPHNLVKTDIWLYSDYGKIRYTSDVFHSFPIKKLWYSIKEIYSSDIVHLTSVFYPPSFLLALAALIFKKKVIWSPRGELHEKALIYSNFKKKIILKFIKLLAHCDIIFHATSSEEAINIAKITGTQDKIITVPNLMLLPADIDINRENTLLYLGRLHPIKAIDQLIQSLSSSEQFLASDYILKIAGTGAPEYIDYLKGCVIKNELHHKIIFLGQVDGVEKEALIAASKWLILPSFSENFGNVVIESLSHGTPVIASTGTPWEILNKNNAGFWVDNDTVALSRVLDHVIKMNEFTYLKMSENARNLARKDFDINENINKWVDIYSSLAP